MRSLKFIAILLVVLLALPYGMGRYVESHIPALLLPNHFTGYDIALTDYHSGWLSSSGTLRIKIPDETEATELPFKVNHSLLTHVTLNGQPHWIFGKAVITFQDAALPSLMVITRMIHRHETPVQPINDLNASLLSALHDFLKAHKPDITHTLLISATGQATDYLASPGLKLDAPELNSHIDWRGLKTVTEYNSHNQKLAFTTTLDDLTFKPLEANNNSYVQLGALTIDFSGRLRKNRAPLGTLSIGLKKLVFDFKTAGKSEDSGHIEGLSLKQSTTLESDKALDNLFFEVAIDKAITATKTYGPLHYAMTLKHIDGTVYPAIQKMLAQNPSQLTPQLSNDIATQLRKLLTHSPQLQVNDFSVTAESGVAKANGSVTLLPADQTNDLDTLVVHLMRTTKMEAQVAISEAFALELVQLSAHTTDENQARLILDSEVDAKNLIKDKKGNYTVSMVFQNGSLTVNGRPF